MFVFDKHLEKYRSKGIDHLRKNVPQIQRIESSKKLGNLRFIGHEDLGTVLKLQYDAKVPFSLRNIEQRLISAGLAKRRHILGTRYERNEESNVELGFYGYALQISIHFRQSKN